MAQRLPAVTVTDRRLMRRRLTLFAVVAIVALTSTACAYKGLSMAAQSAVTLHGDGALTAPNAASGSETYNPALAPVGSRLTVALNPSDETTNAELTVSGLLPNRGYAVHAHTNACSADPALDGPHYQNRIDPAATPQAPSKDPEYANPRNEVWLDVRTDATGSGTSRTTVPFVFTDRGPGSIVVHEAMQTATGPGQAGQAGTRIACLTLSAAQPKGVAPRGSR
ncbi:MAG: superoxide dismutase [Pseudonocardiales bacterium]|nr:MAG: superoxide dismutase [Pseudonocardiales bacterium]